MSLRYIKRIRQADQTLDPDKLTPLARRFFDPADRRLIMEIVFKPIVPLQLVNLLIQSLEYNGDTKCLIPESFEYYKRTITHEGDRIQISGHDIDLVNRLPFIPINQDLRIGTQFVLNANGVTVPPGESPDVLEHGLYATTILTDRITPSRALPARMVPFNRRILITYLLPNEYLSTTLIVRQSPINLSIKRCIMFSRPSPLTIRFGTMLNDTPIKLMLDIVTRDLAEENIIPRLDAGLPLSRSEKEKVIGAYEELKRVFSRQAGKAAAIGSATIGRAEAAIGRAEVDAEAAIGRADAAEAADYGSAGIGDAEDSISGAEVDAADDGSAAIEGE